MDLKLLSFSKLASNYAQKDSRFVTIRRRIYHFCVHLFGFLCVSCSSVCGGNDCGSTGHVFDTMALEISQLVTKVLISNVMTTV